MIIRSHGESEPAAKHHDLDVEGQLARLKVYLLDFHSSTATVYMNRVYI